MSTVIEHERYSDTDRICEAHLVAHTGNPSLPSLIRHFERFGGDPRDTLASALHLSEADHSALNEALTRMEAARKKKRYA